MTRRLYHTCNSNRKGDFQQHHHGVGYGGFWLGLGRTGCANYAAAAAAAAAALSPLTCKYTNASIIHSMMLVGLIATHNPMARAALIMSFLI